MVDLERSRDKQLGFNREDIYAYGYGPQEGHASTLASGTARVIKLSERDRTISLMGPLGGIHNLDVLADPDDDLFRICGSAMVRFRLIQPVAVDIDKLASQCCERHHGGATLSGHGGERQRQPQGRAAARI